MPVRHIGKVEKWNDEKGFGFISPRGEADDVFFHISSFSQRKGRPIVGDEVEFSYSTDESGRMRAVDVWPSGVDLLEPRLDGGDWRVLLFPLVIHGAVFSLVALGWVHILVALFCLAMIVLAVGAYGWDKSIAQSGGWRISESTLHLLGVLGGWPGAFAAQRFFRHKLRKPEFMAVFWLTAVLNCGAIVPISIVLTDKLSR